MPLILALLGCGGGAGTEVAAPPLPDEHVPGEPVQTAVPVVEAPAGRLLYVTESAGLPRAALATLAGQTLHTWDGPPGATYPASADPQGTHVLLVAAEDLPAGHQESLWLAPLDGGEAVRIAGPAQTLRSPSWSPDGAFIAVESDLESFRDLYRVPRAGGPPTRLTDAKHGSFEPVISATGRIAFGTSRDGNAEIYTMNAEGSDLRRITDDPTDDTGPTWSPDGQQLAWLKRVGRAVHTWIAAADGSNARPARPPAAQSIDTGISWSPDGRTLAITVQTGPKDLGIELVDLAAGTVSARVDGPGVDEMPAWSPDGRWLVYVASPNGQADLWRVQPDGKGASPVLQGEHPEWLPRWVP